MFNKLYETIKKYIKENYKFLLTLGVLFFFFFFELPYVVYRPGGTIDLKDRIQVENGYKEEGSFSLSYVSMMKGNIPFVLLSYIIPNWDLVPVKEITMQNEDIDESIKRDRIFLEEGLDYATMSAYKLAGKEISIETTHPIIIYLTEEANTDLQLGDIVLKINDQEFSQLVDLQTYINTLQKGDSVEVLVLREDKNVLCHAVVYEMEGSLKIGISIANKYEYKTNPNITIKTEEKESGASGGLMSALAIYNQLVEEDITKGKKIVGTGTIDIEGNVGEIGGIKYKLLGAEKKHADIFLCPIENYEEAKKIKEEKHLKLNLISVKTLEEAVEALKNAS